MEKKNIDFDEELLYSLRKLRYYDYCVSSGIVPLYFFGSFERQFIENLVGSENWIKYQNKCSAIGQTKWRLKLRIDYMVKNFDCMFVTFTLNEFGISLKMKTLKNKICALLKSLNCYYVGNVDYGKENERLHFHFVISSLAADFIKDNWAKYGFTYCEIVYGNSYKLSNYVNKITNHGLKGTTQRYQLITSRGDYAFTDILKEHRLNDKIEKEVSMKENYDIW